MDWELVNARAFGCACLAQQGELRQLCERVPSLRRDAEERGDRFAAVSYRTAYTALPWLVADDVAGGRKDLALALEIWSPALELQTSDLPSERPARLLFPCGR